MSSGLTNVSRYNHFINCINRFRYTFNAISNFYPAQISSSSHLSLTISECSVVDWCDDESITFFQKYSILNRTVYAKVKQS